MAKEPIGIMLYFDKFEQMDKLEDADFRFVLRALIRYCKSGEVPEAFPSLISDVTFGMMRQLMDAENGSKQRRTQAARDAAGMRWHADASENDAAACDDDANACDGMPYACEADAIACDSMRTDAQLATSNKQLATSNEQPAINNEQPATSNGAAEVIDACALEASPAAAGDSGVCAYAANNLQYLSPRNMEELLSFRDDLTEDLIRHGIDEACAAGKRTWAYARSILNRYADAGYKSIGDVEAAEAARAKAGKTGPPGNGRANPALNYAQRTYDDADLEDMFAADTDAMVRAYGGGQS